MTNSRTFYCNGCFASQHESPLIALPGNAGRAHAAVAEVLWSEQVRRMAEDAPDSDAQAELSRAYALIEEMRAGLESIAKVDPGNEFSLQSGMAKKILTKIDTFLAERVK